VRRRLVDGMTVQSDRYGPLHSRHYAYCVRCSWASVYMKYEQAREIATTSDSHFCNRKGK